MTNQIAVVTGANRGLGLEAARQLAQRGYKVIMTARDPAKGLQAMEALKSQGMDVEFRQLDVLNKSDIDALAHYVKKTFSKLDVLINNAGILLDGDDSDEANATSIFKAKPANIILSFETNTLAPLMLAQALIPLMQGNGRVVNISSGMGQLSDMNGGYPAYRLSKTALNAVTKILADELKNTKIKVNSVCPGWVRTDMGGPQANLTIEQGVETIVWLATLPENGPSGGFFRNKKSIAW